MFIYTVSQSSFSCGYSFFYWPKYKNSNFIRGGYKESELFIEKGFYNSLKEEILSNKDNEISDIEIWNKNVILKANQFVNTKKVKSIKGGTPDFDIKYGSTMTIKHIQSLILYTDFSILCSSFSSTFRNKYQTEQLKAIKKRNAKYYYFSKLLIESIQVFGYYPAADEDIGDETLYCGMSIILTMKNANLYLRGPTFSSVSIE